jgi:hypothetical protein
VAVDNKEDILEFISYLYVAYTVKDIGVVVVQECSMIIISPINELANPLLRNVCYLHSGYVVIRS